MKTLMINAHPDFKKEDSFSFKLKEMFLEAYGQLYPNEQPEVLNLYDIQLPRIEKNQLLNVWHKQREGEKLSEVEELISTKTSELLQQFKAYKRIVIISPLHNFNITSRLKDYIDNIMIARETFKYTENGSVGLMTDNYKALYLQAIGSI
ncbi:FMN-dependent NADH-azoreductase, partial [Staphylococcus cohnii]